MAEDAFERFRRLRGLTTQKCPPETLVNEVGPLEDSVLVDDNQPPAEIEGKDQPETMSPLALLRTLHARGIKMTPYPEGKVRCHAPQRGLDTGAS
jgi:hypothetical protein